MWRAALHMLVGGFFIRRATIHGIWIWLYWISFVQWTWSALMINEFENQEYYDHCANPGGEFTAPSLSDCLLITLIP